MDDDLHTAWNSAATRLTQIRKELPTYPVRPLRIARVTQQDAQLLDNELENILLEPLVKSLQLLRDPSTFLPELTALLRFCLLGIALTQSGASYGSRLQNLIYRDEFAPLHPAPQHFKSLLYATLCTLPGYVHTKLRDAMLSKGWSDYPSPRHTLALFSPFRSDDAQRKQRERKRWAWESWNSLEKLWQAGKLINFLVFLHDGRYRTLIDRMLGLRLVYRQRTFARQVSFEFLNRQLVWEAFTEFLLFLLPLINLRKIRLRLTRSLHATPLSPYLPGFLTSSTTKTQGLLPDLGKTTCPLCFTRTRTAQPGIGDADPTDPTTAMFGNFTTPSESETQVRIPYVVDCCQGLYCYYCIVGQLVKWDEETQGLDGNWICVRCGMEVGGVRRSEAEVEEEGEKAEKSEE